MMKTSVKEEDSCVTGKRVRAGLPSAPQVLAFPHHHGPREAWARAGLACRDSQSRFEPRSSDRCGGTGARDCTADERKDGAGQAPARTPTTDKARYPITEGESLALSHKYTVFVNYD